jgi:GNAT superfamily N-acetyltransferase
MCFDHSPAGIGLKGFAVMSMESDGFSGETEKAAKGNGCAASALGMAFANLSATLRLMGNLAGARFSDDPAGLVLYDGGVKDSFENYALLSPAPARGNLASMISEGLNFFSEANLPHIWPIFPGVPESACDILLERGLARDDDFYAMIADTSGARSKKDARTREVSGPIHGEAAAIKWAECAWAGFDSGDEAPEAFLSLAVNMSRRGEFSLVHIDGQATGMLCASGGTAGIYYVSTRPESRRRGLAGAIMDKLAAIADEAGARFTTLLATPSGRPLYLKHGFKDIAPVKIFRSG